MANIIEKKSFSWKELANNLPGVKKDMALLITSSILINLLALALPLSLMQVYDRIIPNSSFSTLGWIVVGLVSAMILEGILKILRGVISSWISSRIEHYVGSLALSKLLSSRLEKFESHGAGVHLERLNAVSVLRSFYTSQVFQILMDAPFILLFLLIEYNIGGYLAFYTLGIVLVFLVFVRFVKGKYSNYRKLLSSMNDRQYNFIVETLGGVHTVKSMAMEEQMHRRYESILYGMSSTQMKMNLWNLLPANMGSAFAQINTLGVIALGAAAVMGGSMSVGGMTACAMIAGRVMNPAQQLGNYWLRRSEARIAAKQLENLFIESEPKYERDENEKDEIYEDLKGTISTQDFSVYSDDESDSLLENLNINIESGSIVAICGGSFNQQSGLLLALAGLKSSVSGKRSLDEYDMDDGDIARFAGRVHYISRKTNLFKGTIIENITMFDSGNTMVALDTGALVGLDDMVADLPQGYETIVDPQASISLTNGLLQKISLARALVVRPRVIFFDQTFHGLDRQSRDIFVSIISKLKGTCTIVFNASLNNLPILPDKILQINDKSLMEMPDSLLENLVGESFFGLKTPESVSKFWDRWVMQTATTWDDISTVLKRTGIEIIDQDHRQLAEYAVEVNRLVYQLNNRNLDLKVLAKQKEILEVFYRFTLSHYKREEDLIKKYHLKGLDIQQKEHGKILKLFGRSLNDFKEGKVTITHQLKFNLLEWLIEHSNKVDFETFRMENFSESFLHAEKISDIKEIIVPTGIPVVDEENSKAIESLFSFCMKMTETNLDEMILCHKSAFQKQKQFLNYYKISGWEKLEEKYESLLDQFENYRSSVKAEVLLDVQVKKNSLEKFVEIINGVQQQIFAVEKIFDEVISKVNSAEEISWLIRKTNVGIVDDQHFNMIKYIFEIFRPEREGEKLKKEEILLLEKTAAEHFATEERIMEKQGIDSLDGHKQEHRHLMTQIREHLVHAERGHLLVNRSFRNRLMSWWVSHTNGTDYRTFVLHAGAPGGKHD